MPDLATLAQLKQDLVITNDNSDDQLQRLLTEISAWFLNQINRGALLSATYTERRNGSGGDSIVPRYFPLSAVSSITVNGLSIPVSPDGVQGGFIFDQWTIFMVGCYRFTRGRQNVVLNYTAGYAAVPPEVERAVLDQCVFTFRRLPRLGTITQTLQGVTVATFSQKDMAPGVQGVIDSYKDKALVGL
jgi:hypothetical protein